MVTTMGISKSYVSSMGCLHAESSRPFCISAARGAESFFNSEHPKTLMFVIAIHSFQSPAPAVSTPSIFCSSLQTNRPLSINFPILLLAQSLSFTQVAYLLIDIAMKFSKEVCIRRCLGLFSHCSSLCLTPQVEISIKRGSFKGRFAVSSTASASICQDGP